MNHINNNEVNFVFTSERSPDSINFLDLTIYIEDNHIKTKTYFKEVDASNFLLNSSCHHQKWLNNIPYGQFRRIRRNCSDMEIFKEQASILKTRFEERHYRPEIIENALSRASQLSNEQLLVPKQKKDNLDSVVPFVTRYNNEAKNIKKILKRHWHVLRKDIGPHAVSPDKAFSAFYSRFLPS